MYSLLCKKSFAALITLAGLLGTVAWAQMPMVRVSERVDVAGDVIRLADLARFENMPPDLARHLGSLVVARAPLPGDLQRLDRAFIRMRLKQARVNLNSLDMRIPAHTVIYRQSMLFPTEEIRKAVFERLDTLIHWPKRQIDVSVRAGSEQTLLPAGDLQIDVQVPTDRDLLGAFPVAVELMVDDRPVKRIWVKAVVKAFSDAVVAQRALGRRQPITTDDVALKEIEISHSPTELISRLDQAIGKRTRRVILPGTALTTAMVEVPPMLRRGDLVTIVAETQGLRITTMGEAKVRGRKGERIEVLNLDSQKTIYARVVDPQTVRVDLAQRRPQ